MTETELSPQHQQIQQRLAYLETALFAQDPAIKGHLAEIHRLMITHEELVHLLSIEELQKLMGAQQVVTNQSLVAAVSSKGGKTTTLKKATGLSMGDL